MSQSYCDCLVTAELLFNSQISKYMPDKSAEKASPNVTKNQHAPDYPYFPLMGIVGPLLEGIAWQRAYLITTSLITSR
jgi:hypothetical protein